MKSKHVLSATVLALCAFSAATAGAQTQSPGLWEHTMNMKTQGGEMEKAMADMQKQMASMPPEQRKQMEAALARSNVKMGPGGTSVKVCVTQEEAARQPEARMQGDCKQLDVQRSGNKMSYRFECTKPPSKGTGEMTFISDKAYSGKADIDTQIAGKAQHMTMEMSGKWLASECGDVKPRQPPSPK